MSTQKKVLSDFIINPHGTKSYMYNLHAYTLHRLLKNSSSVKMTKYSDNGSKLTVNYDIIILPAIFMYQDILQDIQCIQAVEMSEGLFHFLGKNTGSVRDT